MKTVLIVLLGFYRQFFTGNMFKRLIVLLLVFSMYVAVNAEQKKVVFELTSGDIITYTLDQVPKFTYGEKTVTISYSSGSIEYNMSEIKKLRMEDPATGIGEITLSQNKGELNNENGVFNFSNFEVGSKILLYDISGLLIGTYKIPVDGSLCIDTNELQSGTYIFKTNNSTYKFIKK